MRVLTLAGSGAQRGLDYGREEAAAIAAAVTALKTHLASLGHSPGALMRRLATGPLPRAAADLTPELWAETIAMAQGARVGLDEVLLLVFASDLDSYAGTATASPDGLGGPSASFGASAIARQVPGRPGDTGGGGLAGQARPPVPPTTEIGQTVDLPDWARDRALVLRIGAYDAPNALALAYPGSLGLCGANQSGLGVATTALPWSAVDAKGLGVTFIVRHLLTLETLAAAESFLMSVPHAVGRSYLIAAPDGIACYEADPGNVIRVRPASEVVAHTDHRLGSADAEGGNATESSMTRLATLTRAMDAHVPLAEALGADVLCDGSRWQDALITFGAFRAAGGEASARFIAGDALARGRDWDRLTYV
ncbi:MAG: hypothetical protein GC156_12255 [Actinomycetales bacterium]|nr:hypothetical protein [Actinomycetales bacterium]